MPNFNPFSNDAEDTSFETGMPVTQAAKAATNTMTKAAQAQADAAAKKATDDLVDFLYAPSTPDDQGTDETNTQHTDASNASTRVASTHASVSKTAKVNPNQTPEEQEKMEKIRHELFGNYSATFKQAGQNGAHNITTSLDQEMEKARKEREQKEMQRKQEEEEEEKRKKEEEEAQKEEFAMPAGKKTGFQMGKKQQEPMALRLAKTKTEINRGASG
jgi:hypothetical protein